MGLIRKLTDTTPQPSTHNHTTTKPATDNQQPRPKTTFFSLPAELRNKIYHLAALHTTILVIPPLPTSTSTFTIPSTHKPPVPAHSLLHTTHQTLTEFRPILLSHAPIRIPITNFHFKPLVRVIGSLYRSELTALRVNKRLTIDLEFRSPCKRRIWLADLRRWVVGRADSLDRLPWGYRFVAVERGEGDGWVEGRRERKEVKLVGEATEMLGCLWRSEKEAVRFEIEMMLRAFPAEGDPGK